MPVVAHLTDWKAVNTAALTKQQGCNLILSLFWFNKLQGSNAGRIYTRIDNRIDDRYYSLLVQLQAEKQQLRCTDKLFFLLVLKVDKL